MTTSIIVEVNGETLELAPGTTVAGLATERGAPPSGFAVARNGEVVPRSSWDKTTLDAGDRVEILTAAAGG